MALLRAENEAEFKYNNSKDLDVTTDFSEWINYYLNGTATIDSKGDKSNIKWKNEADELCVEEFPVYMRTKTGTGLLANFILKRDLTIRFYKKDDTYEEIVLPTKTYSKKDRIEAEIKSRTNIIERCREKVGFYIYQKNMVAGTPEKIEPELIATTEMLKLFNGELSTYRNDREIGPLVIALQNFQPITNVPQGVIDYIITLVNIEYYT